jgi:hypothetical protein
MFRLFPHAAVPRPLADRFRAFVATFVADFVDPADFSFQLLAQPCNSFL